MKEKNKPTPNYQRINPDDYLHYEDGFIKKGGGGGKSSSHKGKKTIHALKKQQRNQSVKHRRIDIEDSLKQVLSNFPIVDNLDIHEKNIFRYCAWIEDNISELAALDPSDYMVTFTKSGGPGGQNVNKREWYQ